jgi:glutathione S-transferase
MKLYYSPGACSLAPHIAAKEAGLDLQLEKVDLRAKRTETGRDYLSINPKGAVPALELDNSEVITENAVVLQYLAEEAPEAGLLPRQGIERWRQLELLNYIATELHKGFAPLWNPGLNAEGRQAAIDALSKKFDFVKRQLGGQAYLTGDAFTLADCYAYAVLNWTRMLKVDISRWSELQTYIDRVAERPAVRKALAEEGLG